MPSFDGGTLLRESVQDKIDGLMAERGAFADLVCTSNSTGFLTGQSYVRPSKSSLAGASEERAPGSDPALTAQEMAPFTWDMNEYGDYMDLKLSQVEHLEQSMDPIGEWSEHLKDRADVGVDNKLYTEVTDAGLNNSLAVSGGAWDVSTSKIVRDIRLLKRKSPGLDMALVGYNTFELITEHPAIKEFLSNYSGGGAISDEAGRAAIGHLLGIPANRVFTFGTFYDSANPGQALSVSYTALNLFWVGHQRGLMLEEQTKTSRRAWTFERANKVQLGYNRVLDIVRVDKDLGAFMTGTFT